MSDVGCRMSDLAYHFLPFCLSAFLPSVFCLLKSQISDLRSDISAPVLYLKDFLHLLYDKFILKPWKSVKSSLLLASLPGCCKSANQRSAGWRENAASRRCV